MAIFSRRTIQHFLNANRQIISEEAVVAHVKRLNREDRSSLDAEWEVALVHCLSKIGLVKHEANLGGSTRLDLFFKSDNIEFAADITTVSDKHQEKHNDYYGFVSAVDNTATKMGLESIGGLHFDVKGKDIGKYPKKKVSLKLPKQNDYQQFINKHIKPFLLKLRESPTKKRTIDINDDDSHIILSYDPNKGRYVSVGPVWDQWGTSGGTSGHRC